MGEYIISQDIAHQIAVGIYRQIGVQVEILKNQNPDDYKRFVTEYNAKRDKTKQTKK